MGFSLGSLLGGGSMMGISTAGSLAGSYLQAEGAKDAAGISAAASHYAADLGMRQYEQTRADLAPYREVATGEGGALYKLAEYGPSRVVEGDYIPATEMPVFDPNIDIYQDPSYKFRVAEQERAINRNMSSMGKILSGNRIEEIMKRSGEMASQEYANIYGRAIDDYKLQAGREATMYGRGVDAYSRAYGREQDYLNYLRNLAGVGQTATTQTAAAGQSAAAQAGQYIQSAGEAQAAGRIGEASAYTNLINQGMQLYGMYQAQQPQINYFGTPTRSYV